MRKVNSWVRTALALVAVLVVALPALVSASSPEAVYARPRLAMILGPEIIRVGQPATYQLYVVYSDNTKGVVGFPPAVLYLNRTQVSGGTVVPSAAGFGLLTAKYSVSSGSVTANRVVLIQP